MDRKEEMEGDKEEGDGGRGEKEEEDEEEEGARRKHICVGKSTTTACEPSIGERNKNG